MEGINTIEDAIGELLGLADAASDNVSKNVISAYKKELDYNINLKNISSSKFTKSDLEKCATFLKIELPK